VKSEGLFQIRSNTMGVICSEFGTAGGEAVNA
jgi:hypothetical protein